MRIAFLGLGKLGLPLAVCMAKAHDVVGHDVDPRRMTKRLDYDPGEPGWPGGDFRQQTDQGQSLNGLLAWNGSTRLSAGFVGSAETLDIHSYDLADGSGNHTLLAARAGTPYVMRSTANPASDRSSPKPLRSAGPTGNPRASTSQRDQARAQAGAVATPSPQPGWPPL